MSTINPYELLAAIRDANYDRAGVQCLRLLQLEPDFFGELQADVERLCAAQRPSNVHDPTHITHWTRPSGKVLQYSLLNATGRYDDFSSDHDLSCFGKRFHESTLYPALARTIAGFPHAINFRINLLGSGGGLSPHKEHTVVRDRFGTVGIRPRLHLPVVTNPGAEVILNGEVYQLEEGVIYFVNHGCVHSAGNRGSELRTHLVWDLLFTRESFDLLFGDDPDLPFPASRLPASEQRPIPLRVERLGSARRLPEPVSEEEARAVDFLEPQ